MAKSLIYIQFVSQTYNYNHINTNILHFNMQIPDNPSVVESIFKQMKQNLKTRETHSIQFRKKALTSLLEGYDKLKAQFDEAMKQDLGLNPFMANFYAHGLTKNEINDLKSHLDEWSKAKTVETPVTLGIATSSIQHQPLGLVLVISAWNYPIYTSLPQVAAAIAAGNSVILKPSELAPHTSHVLARLFRQYMNQKYYRCIQGKKQVAIAISKLPFDMICFTGSTATGRAVAIQAAKNLTPCLLELGGKCPVIVDQTADIDSAVLRILFGKFINCGQTCVGVDHVYVSEKIADKFKNKLLEKLKQGYSLQQIRGTGNYAKIINEGHVERLTEYLNQNHGGRILFEGVIDKKDRFISPFVVENPKNDSLLMTEEIFGPILPLKIFGNLDQVINEIGARPKPLVIYVFSQERKNIDKLKNNTISGTFVVNDVVVQLLNPHLPFGGVGASGYGRYHGQSGYLSFSNPRSICQTKAINWYPLSNRFAPYTDSKKRMMTFLLKTSGITYQSLGRKMRYLVLVAAAIGLYFANKNMRPKI